MTRPAFTVLDPARYRRTPWKNGGGVTVDIAGAYRPGASPGGWDGMLWRFGRTRIERPGPFSDLSGYDRVLAVVEGSGLVLHPKFHAPIEVRAPFAPVHFPGEWAITSELTAGPVGVLNLMADRLLYEIDLAFPPTGAAVEMSGAVCIVLALDDAAVDVGGRTMALARDTALRIDDAHRLAYTARAGRLAVAAIRD
jgi:hypothetical protein